KPYGLFDVITEHLGNLRVVNNNPDSNLCRCTFEPYAEWWRLQDGEWEVQSRKLYYAAGPGASDNFNAADSMFIILYTTDGRTLETCPEARGSVADSDGSDGVARSGADESVYPNPVPLGGMVYLRETALVDENQVERYETYRLFGSQGRLVSSGKASALLSGLTMPDTPATYYLILEGKAGRRAMQIAVGRRSR
ncbi:MAG: hypothetical protein LBF67_07770, partial [Prevotellaceae bacterium]|nr:hypothetical protein [Prevotellaceae bacterium]